MAALLRAKSPVRDGEERLTEVGVRLERVKSQGALELWMATGPKSCWVGVRRRPVRGRPSPVSARVYGLPLTVEARASDAV